jgi:endonuclease/exonuclease/phosphatase (EEP) superfamily protein YafD
MSAVADTPPRDRTRSYAWVGTALTVPWATWAAVRTLGLDVEFPAAALLAFTPYVAATSLLPVVVAALMRRWKTALVALAAAALLVTAVAPRAIGGQPAPAEGAGRVVTLMSANLRLGHGDAEAVMRLADDHDVDILCLQEVTTASMAALDAAGARERLPDRVVEPRDDGMGNALLAPAGAMVERRSDPSAAPQPEAVLRVPGATNLRVRSVHPYPPLDRGHDRTWRDTLRGLPSAGGDGRDGLRILAGDFNATLDHRELRRLIARGYVDAADAVGAGLRPTWRMSGLGLGLTIDHVLADRRIAVQRYEIAEIPDSDHRALLVWLLIPRGTAGRVPYAAER